MIEILFAKLNENAKIPTKRLEDAGYDIFACFEEDYIIIKPNETVKINTKIASCFPMEYCMILKERGSTGVLGFGQRAGVIDSGYRNEWLIPITNHNEKPIIIIKDEYKNSEEYKNISENFIEYSYNKAICQALLVEVPISKSIEVDYDKILNIKSERMMDGFGSTNKRDC